MIASEPTPARAEDARNIALATLALAATRPEERRKMLGIFLRHAAVATAANLVIALFVALFFTHGRNVFYSVVFSLCIGTSIWLFIDAGRFLLWRANKPSRALFFLMLLIVAPPAYYTGMVIGALLLGLPLAKVLPPDSTSALLSVAFTLFVTMIAGWMFINRMELARTKEQAAEQAARAAQIEKQALQAQLQLLQAQIEPHMLFNTLANLQGLIALDPPRAREMLDHLIQYLRATLAASRAQTTTLAQEFMLMDAFLGLMSVRMGKRLSYALDLPDALRRHAVPPMLLQPLIENAIKHGLEPKVDGGRIEVGARIVGDLLELTVTDTGLGIGEDGLARHSEPGTRVGLANIRERLHALYGGAASLTISPAAPTGVVARILLPFAP